MIFHFQTGDVTFFAEDQEYFEKRLFTLKKLLGSEAGDEDTLDMQVKISKNKKTSGNRFEASAVLTGPNGGKFHTEISADTIKKCADLIQDKLKSQIQTFHGKHK